MIAAKQTKRESQVKPPCGYCRCPTNDGRAAYLRYGSRKQEKYDYVTVLCPGCRQYLRGKFSYTR